MQHHATLFVGSFDRALEVVPERMRTTDADTRHIVVEQFGIADARSLTAEAVLRPVANTHRVFVVAFARATHEAQNALLKLLEEPVSTTRFYIVVPREDVLIQTVRSRLSTQSPITDAQLDTTIARKFMTATPAERIVEIAARTKAGDTVWIQELLSGLEVIAHESQDRRLMHELLFVEQYITSSGASKKILLEHLALA